MPLFRVQVFKTHPLNGDREWSNDYFVRASTLTLASGAATTIRIAEQAFHNVATIFTKSRTSSVTPHDDAFVTEIVNEPGTRTNPSNNLPLFDVVRVDMSVVGGGRPSRKYYRLPLGTSDVANLVVDSTLRSTIDAALSALIADLNTAATPWVDPDDQEINDAAAAEKVGMRQLHRKRRKKTTP